jgi:hypothetical protein
MEIEMGTSGGQPAPCYVVQTFTDLDGELVPDMPLDVSNASEAANVALAFRSCKAGVIAFEWSGAMRHLEPYVIAAFGQIPDECSAWIRAADDERTPRKSPLVFLC